MKKIMQTMTVTFCFLLATAGLANAQEAASGGAIGVGAETMLLPPDFGGGAYNLGGAAEFVYDAGQFHIDGLLIYSSIEDDVSMFGIGGRGFFVVHRGASADFSVGGGLAVIVFSPNVGDSSTDILLDGGAKIRVHLNENVALHTTLGLSFYVADGNGRPDTLGLASRLLGNIGMTYFFR